MIVGWWDVMSNASGHVGYFWGAYEDDLYVVVQTIPDGERTIGARHIVDMGSGIEFVPPTVYATTDDAIDA